MSNENHRYAPGSASPPPSYNSLFPESQHTNSESLIGLDDITQQQNFQAFMEEDTFLETSFQQYVVVDAVSQQKMEKNQQRSQKSLKNPKLESIDVYKSHQRSRINGRQALNFPRTLASRQEFGTTFVGECGVQSPNSVEYALLPPIPPSRVYDVVRNFIAASRRNYACFEIKDIKTLYLFQNKLGTIWEKRSLTTVEKPARSARGERSSSTDQINPPFSMWDVNIPLPEDRLPRKVDFINPQSSSSCKKCDGKGKTISSPHIFCKTAHDDSNRMTCSKCKGLGRMESHFQVTAEWFKLYNSYYGPIYDCKKTEVLPTITTEFLNQCQGLVVYDDAPSSGEINPISNKDILDQDVIAASDKLIAQHRAIAAEGKIVKQRQSVSAIPVYRVVCKAETKFDLWIFGTNHVLHNFNLHRVHS